MGTGLKYNRITENQVDERRVKQLMEVCYRLRR
jgi:predicted TIM-barrel enzyme